MLRRHEGGGEETGHAIGWAGVRRQTNVEREKVVPARAVVAKLRNDNPSLVDAILRVSMTVSGCVRSVSMNDLMLGGNMRFTDRPDYDRWYAQEILRNAFVGAKRNDGAISQDRTRKGSDGSVAMKAVKRTRGGTQQGNLGRSEVRMTNHEAIEYMQRQLSACTGQQRALYELAIETLKGADAAAIELAQLRAEVAQLRKTRVVHEMVVTGPGAIGIKL